MMNAPATIERPFFGVVVEWYGDSDIVVYKVVAISDEIIKQWAALVQSIIASWPANKPYYAVHDLSQPGISLQYAALVDFETLNIGVNHAGKVQIDKLFTENPSLSAKVAINLNLSLSGQTNRALMSNTSNAQQKVIYKLFYSRARAFEWLQATESDTNENKHAYSELSAY